MRRRLLKQAVEDNYATIFGSPAPAVRHRKIWRRLSRLGAWTGALAVLSAATFVLATRGLSRPTVAVAERPVLAVPPPPVRPSTARAVVGPPSFDLDSASPMDRSVLPFSVRRIVIDAGHGGEHRGTASSRGVEEKMITLDMAERLAELLAANGFEPLLTRTGDETLSLVERGSLANEQEGDVFVSIHVNWFAEADVRAVETFYLGPTQDAELQRLAARENLDSGIPLGEFRQALERVYADVRREESRQLARAVHHELIKSLQTVNPGVEDRGVKSAPFGVLIRTRMPAILTEVGCLSNDQEARLLESADYRQFLAQAIFEGIRSYALELNPKLTLGS
ncbi:MAG: N-acetylmuramoyl-L-alanine amidase [Acidobacteria bacterium]|nr:N-acetylmuramoyl-L-alanine amidase [Acidobacteriota bacterium]